MNWLQYLMATVSSAVVVQNVGWLLIHSLWQGTLIALVASFIAQAMRRRTSSARYWLYSMALLLMIVAPVVTMFAFPQVDVLAPTNDQLLQRATPELNGDVPKIKGNNAPNVPVVAALADEEFSSKPSKIRPSNVPDAEPTVAFYSNWIKAVLRPWLSSIVTAWCCGVLLFSCRPIWGWLMVRRLLTTGTSTVATHVQEALQRVCEKMQVRRPIEVLASTLVGSPIVVGCFRSVILIPTLFVSNLPIAQLEAILAHELAHVRRYDYLVNLLQTLVETLFFYHPTAWWLSHRIRVERENCCDDWVVAVFDNKAEYGRALLAVEEYRVAATRSALALSARDGSLLQRVRRLLEAPNGSNERMSTGFAALATAVTGIAISLAFWSAISAAQNKDSDLPFGEPSHGLRARIVTLRPDVNDNAPNMELFQNDYEKSNQLTIGIELNNVGNEPLTLAGVRYGEGFTKEVQGTPQTALLGPHWFEFEFIDSAGKPLRRAHRQFHQPWQVLYGASTHELAPKQSLIEVLRPGKFHAPMNFDLPPGKYKVRVRYRGPDKEFLNNVRRGQADKPILKAWPHQVVSNTIEFEVAERRMPSEQGEDRSTSDRSSDAAKLVWGKPVGGLQAAMEYRLAAETLGDPTIAPGIPVGTPFNVIFHVRNVSDKTITFISETGRQGDAVHVTNERGEKIVVKDVWYSGWPIDVVWKLEPGEIAQLNLLTPSLNSLDQPGSYNVRYTIRFNSRVQKDDAGNVIFPRPGDYDQEVDTGETPLILTALQTNAASVKPKTQVATRGGRWQITEDAELEITQKLVHASDVMTSGVVRMQGDMNHPRHLPLSFAVDYFANRERWKAVWEEGKPVLWCAKGLGDGPGRALPAGTKVKIEELRRIDFGNPDCIIHHLYSGWAADQLPASDIRAALEESFEIKSDGQELHRCYESARQGLQPDNRSMQLFVWVGENGECQVQNLVGTPNTGERGEVKCDLKTLPETIALVLKEFRANAGTELRVGAETPIYAFISTRSDLKPDELKTVLDVCREHGLKTPALLKAGPPDHSEHGLNRLKNDWREFYAATSANDATYIRNAFVDFTAAAATDDDVRSFINDSAADKRAQLIDRLLADFVFDKFHAQLSNELDAFKTQQQTLPPRILRGPHAKHRAAGYITRAGRPVNGLVLAVALRSATNRFSIGERIPLDVLILNTSQETITQDFSFDFIANPPRVLDEAGNEVRIEKILLTGAIPLYRETLRPGDYFVYPHIGLGLGDNPQTGENWHPHTPLLRPGKYRLTQQWKDLTSGDVEFEVVAGDSDNARAGTRIEPAWLRQRPGTQIVEHTAAEFVSGVVVDVEGRPIAGCSVEHPGLVGPKTDDQGKFQYKQSVPHRTVLRAYHPEYRLWHGSPELGDVVRIVLHKKPTVEAVRGAREMTVRVIDSRTAEPVPNVKVTASRYEGPQKGSFAATAVTNQDGTAVMRGLDFIQYQLLMSADQPVSYIGDIAYPGADEHEVVMLVDRACELVLRAVDSETGRGIAGVKFERENAVGERWQQSIDPEILGGKHVHHSSTTDADGYFRCLVSSYPWSYMVSRYPEGYGSIVPIAGAQEVEIRTTVGGRVEYTFRLIRTRD